MSRQAAASRPLTASARRLRRGGFTLVELIATIAVLAVLGSVASSIIFTATDGYLRGVTQAQLHVEASTALDRIVRELRDIERHPNPSAPGVDAPYITAVTATSIHWEQGASLALSGDRLMLTGDEEPRVLAIDVSSLAIQTFNESNQALAATLNGAACEPIRRVRIALSLERHGVSVTLRTRLFLRSMMLGGSGGGA